MERITIITGWSKHHKQMDLHPDILDAAKGQKEIETGYVVFGWDTKGNKIEYKPEIGEIVTLKQCQGILSDAETLTGNEYSSITIRDCYYDEYGHYASKKTYDYNKKHNRLTIWENDLPIYENWNGTITRDRDALADCLC
jgi:hypothetical protein